MKKSKKAQKQLGSKGMNGMQLKTSRITEWETPKTYMCKEIQKKIETNSILRE